jgi:hypothetical protein
MIICVREGAVAAPAMIIANPSGSHAPAAGMRQLQLIVAPAQLAV